MLCKYPRRVDCAVSSNTWILESVFQGRGVVGSGRLAEKLSGGWEPPSVWQMESQPTEKQAVLTNPPGCSVSPRSRAEPGKTALVLS